MKGKIRTRESCRCGRNFAPVYHPLSGDQIDLKCPCGLRPTFFYIDARDLKAGKIYRYEGRKFDSFLLAHRQLEKMRSDVDRGIFDPRDWQQSKKAQKTLKVMSDVWLGRIGKTRSWSYYRHCVNDFNKHIIPAVGEHTDIKDLRTAHSEKIMAAMEGRAPKTIRNALVTFQTFCNWLYYIEEIQRIPRIPRIPSGPSRGAWINREKQELILGHIPPEHRLIFETLMETAERPGEVCAHMARDLLDGEIMIERAFDERGNLKARKNNKVYYRGISLGLWRRLRDHTAGMAPDDYMFTHGGQPYTRNRLYRLWKRASRAAGIEIDLYHGTRHSRASQKRLERERELAEELNKDLGNTVAMRYARDRKEEV